MSGREFDDSSRAYHGSLYFPKETLNSLIVAKFKRKTLIENNVFLLRGRREPGSPSSAAVRRGPMPELRLTGFSGKLR